MRHRHFTAPLAPRKPPFGPETRVPPGCAVIQGQSGATAKGWSASIYQWGTARDGVSSRIDQTETGAIMIAPMPGAVALKPGSGTLPLPGVLADVVDLFGKPVEANQEGFLIVRRPWPSMARTL